VNWDAFITEAANQADEAATLPPDGRHVGEIVSARLEDVPFDWAKSENNPNGTCLVVFVEVPKFRQFKSSTPLHFSGKISALCASAAVTGPQRGTPIDTTLRSLEGRTVIVETALSVSGRGTEYVKVTKWIKNADPVPPAVKERAAPKRSQTAKANAELSPDDIPF
jgi:hypothetical protein